MQTVNFNCPHCGNLMAVGTNLLGRNVRCPHCKQVVRAPAAPGEAPAPPAITPPPPASPRLGTLPSFNVARPTEAHESIFGERHDEDVFGSEPPRPTLPPSPSSSASPEQAPPTPVTVEEVIAIVTPPPPSVPSANPLAFDTTFTPSNALASDPEPRTATQHAGSEPPARPSYQPRAVREPAPATPAFAWILLVYAGLTTVAAGFFGYQYFTGGQGHGDHPYKAIPDFYGQYQKADRRQVSVTGLPDPKLDIPPELRVRLGDELTVGDLKVTPMSVEQQKIVITTDREVGDANTNPAGQSLVLTLRVKNTSTDTVFDPNDPAFRRARKEGQPFPYTALQIGRTFYYGIFPWPPEPGVKRYFVEGQDEEEKRLGPGEERDTWVTVAPRGIKAAMDDVLADVAELKKKQNPEPLLWRVQLRRGMVQVKDDSGKEVDISATTVIGVEFRADQIKQ
jgi:phage FluMu protein Com